MSEKTIAETITKLESVQNGPIGVVKYPNYVFKLDLRLIPILGCTYTLLFLDRTNSKLRINRKSSTLSHT